MILEIHIALNKYYVPKYSRIRRKKGEKNLDHGIVLQLLYHLKDTKLKGLYFLIIRLMWGKFFFMMLFVSNMGII